MDTETLKNDENTIKEEEYILEFSEQTMSHLLT